MSQEAISQALFPSSLPDTFGQYAQRTRFEGFKKML